MEPMAMKIPSKTAAILALVLALSACGRGETEAEAPARAPAEGRITVQVRPVQDLKPVSAELTTRDMAEARSRIGGLLVSLSVQEGDLVRRGQPIALVRDDRIGLLTGAYDAQAAAAAAGAATSTLAESRAPASQSPKIVAFTAECRPRSSA